MMKISLSTMEQEAVQVLERLELHGYSAFFVGGYVRDCLLGRPVHDIDLATSALPEQVLELFPHCIPTGLQHGTVTVVMDLHSFEVTTFRTESEYEQYRRPKKVEYVSRLEDDLRRRDFTINAMAMNRHFELIDPFGGRKDMERQLIRCVGEPLERFQEDALRLIRCIRFSANFGFSIEPKTEEALHRCAYLLKHIAMERVQAEWDRIMAGPKPWYGLTSLIRHGLIQNVKDELPVSYEMWENAFASELDLWLSRLNNSVERWCAVFWTLKCAPNTASDTLKILKYPNRFIEETSGLLHVMEQWKAWHGFAEELERPFIQQMVDHGKERLLQALSIIEQAPMPLQSIASTYFTRTWQENGSFIRDRLISIPVHQLSDLQITGNDLIQSGIRPGPHMGNILKKLLLQCALGELPNERNRLLHEAKLLYSNQEV